MAEQERNSQISIHDSTQINILHQGFNEISKISSQAIKIFSIAVSIAQRFTRQKSRGNMIVYFKVNKCGVDVLDALCKQKSMKAMFRS